MLHLMNDTNNLPVLSQRKTVSEILAATKNSREIVKTYANGQVLVRCSYLCRMANDGSLVPSTFEVRLNRESL